MIKRVTVSNQPQVVTVSSATAQRLSSLVDVVGSPQNGSLLQYDSATNSWVVSNIIERPGLIINCGNY